MIKDIVFRIKGLIIKIIIILNNKRIFLLPDKIYLKILYKARFNKKINLDNPQTFNEKLQWLKLYDRKKIYTTMVDKYEVKQYVSEKIGKEYIIPTLGIYNKWEDIEFNDLPEQFVIKCTHDSRSAIICKNKESFDRNKAKIKIKKALKRNYFYSGREWPYKNVKPRIIIEKYIKEMDSNSVKDYKLFVFNGKVKCSLIVTERDTGNPKFTFFDKDKNLIDIKQCGAENDPSLEMPKQYDEMVKIAEKLAKGTIQVRADFYIINNKIYFGELTFFDSSGFGKFEPEEWDLKLGKMLKLPNEKSEENEK